MFLCEIVLSLGTPKNSDVPARTVATELFRNIYSIPSADVAEHYKYSANLKVQTSMGAPAVTGGDEYSMLNVQFSIFN
jgi:hypothetical protein